MNARTLIALLLAAVAAGCTVDNDASVRFAAACFPPVPNDDGSCSYPSTCDSVMLDNLWVDPSWAPTGGTLVWPFQVDNLRPDNSSLVDGRTNTATAFITGFRIAYASSAVSLPEAIIEYSTRTIEPESSQVLSIPVVPLSVATQLTAIPGGFGTLRAEIRATGHYADGTSIETGPFSVVVVVQNGGWTGGTCTDPTQTVRGYCPQDGQTGLPLCK
jgi:hypothetical protein